MVALSYNAKSGRVYIDYPADEEEEKSLQGVLGQIKAVCKIVGPKGKTGLRIVKEMIVDGRLCAVLSLGDIIQITQEEEVEIKRLVEAHAGELSTSH